MNFFGILLGLSSFLSIGIFHPIVIAVEYHFSCRVWPAFFIAGAACLTASACVPGLVLSAVLGVIGFSCLWSIIELFQQKKRVERGWFRANPKHHPSAANQEQKPPAMKTG